MIAQLGEKMKFINQVEPYITEKEIEAINEYLKSGGWLTEFRKTKEFEERIAEYIGVKHAIVVTSGMVGLYLSVLAHGIGRDDKVLVPNYTMIATINAITWAGAEPVLVDIDPENLCLDLSKIRNVSKCKAMMYVPINGRFGNMDEIVNYCESNNLILIEDSCQAMGSEFNGRKIGSFGSAGVFSFTPHKIITTGQGGAVVTNDYNIANKVRKLKDFHRTAPATDWHDGLGFNFKFTDLQAVIGIEQIKTIDFRVKRKKEIYQRYQANLSGIHELTMPDTDYENMVPWFVDAFLESESIRDGLSAYLSERNIGSRPTYPPINRQSIYEKNDVNYPVSGDFARRGLWLPSSIGLSLDVIDYVCNIIVEYMNGG